LTKLARKVHSLEQMESLLAFTKRQEHLKGKTVYLGNLANTNNLLGWKQSQQPLPSKLPPGTTPSKLTSISGLQNVTLNPPPQPEIADKPMVKLPEFKLRRMNKPSSVAQ
jgi:hypothetical protein